MSFALFAATAPGLEALTAAELQPLGARSVKAVPGGVEFEGPAELIWRANLWLRTASRVLVRIGEFRAAAFYELERHARKIAWDRYLDGGRPVRLSVTCRKSKLYHSGGVAERVLEAIERRVGALPSSEVSAKEGEEEDDTSSAQRVFVRLFHDQCTVSLDSSGELLHRRGYRQALSRAPLRETLAAAMLLACDWKGDRPLLDPMCGSGTIPIEAALLARRIAPGIARRFAFEAWPDFDPKGWARLCDEARSRALPATPVKIQGSDLERGAIGAATTNAERAGVAGDLELQVRPFTAIEPPVGPGLLLTNPPYGVRVGERAALRGLYRDLGDTVRAKLPGWSVGLLLPRDAPDAATGMRFSEALDTSNGGIRVRLLVKRAVQESVPEPGR